MFNLKKSFSPCHCNDDRSKQEPVKEIALNSPPVVQTISGEDYFRGDALGTRITFNEKLEWSTYMPIIQPCENPGEGFSIGEVWVNEIDSTGFTVHNSGDATSKFRWMVTLTAIRENYPIIAEPYFISPKDDEYLRPNGKGLYKIVVSPFEANTDNVTQIRMTVQVGKPKAPIAVVGKAIVDTSIVAEDVIEPDDVVVDCVNLTTKDKTNVIQFKKEDLAALGDTIEELYLTVTYYGAKVMPNRVVEVESQKSEVIKVTILDN